MHHGNSYDIARRLQSQFAFMHRKVNIKSAAFSSAGQILQCSVI
jgi:hypothetical protein